MADEVRINDVSAALGGPQLVAEGGRLKPRGGGACIASYQLARWTIDRFPVEQPFVTAYLFTITQQDQTVWLAEIVFMPDNGSDFWPWKTFRVDFPGNKYDMHLDNDLVALLKAELANG